MGSFLTKLCSGSSNPLLALNDTCQRLRCLMACCGGHVQVITREEHDADQTDAATQTDDIEEFDTPPEDKEEKDVVRDPEEEEEEEVDEDQTSTQSKETSI